MPGLNLYIIKNRLSSIFICTSPASHVFPSSRTFCWRQNSTDVWEPGPREAGSWYDWTLRIRKRTANESFVGCQGSCWSMPFHDTVLHLVILFKNFIRDTHEILGIGCSGGVCLVIASHRARQQKAMAPSRPRLRSRVMTFDALTGTHSPRSRFPKTRNLPPRDTVSHFVGCSW